MKLEILPRISNLIWVKVFKAEEYIEQTTLIVVHSGLPNLIVAGICFILECPEAPLLSVESPPDLSWMVFSKAFLNICFGVFILDVASKSWSLESGDASEKKRVEKNKNYILIINFIFIPKSNARLTN